MVESGARPTRPCRRKPGIACCCSEVKSRRACDMQVQQGELDTVKLVQHTGWHVPH